MKTFGETYNPIIQCALNNKKREGLNKIRDVAEDYQKRYPKKYRTMDEAVEQVEDNLAYYVGYYSDSIIEKVKAFYKIGD